MNVSVALVITESRDKYTWVYRNRPTLQEVIQCLHEYEGCLESLEWYEGTTDVTFSEEIITEN